MTMRVSWAPIIRKTSRVKTRIYVVMVIGEGSVSILTFDLRLWHQSLLWEADGDQAQQAQTWSAAAARRMQGRCRCPHFPLRPSTELPWLLWWCRILKHLPADRGGTPCVTPPLIDYRKLWTNLKDSGFLLLEKYRTLGKKIVIDFSLQHIFMI